jgi:nicotinamidase-related amidase
MPLVERSDSLLISIDLQPDFWRATSGTLWGEDDAGARSAARRAGWLAGVARALDIPIVVLEEPPTTNGRTAEELLAHVGPDTPVLAKSIFALTATEDIMAAIEATRRRTTVLVGYETDVCVTHSAIGLLDAGFRVVVVTDAVFSPGDAHSHGLERMRHFGIEFTHSKGLYYEWLRTLEGVHRFTREHPELATPPGFPL